MNEIKIFNWLRQDYSVISSAIQAVRCQCRLDASGNLYARFNNDEWQIVE